VVLSRYLFAVEKQLVFYILSAWATSIIQHAKRTAACMDLHIFHIIT